MKSLKLDLQKLSPEAIDRIIEEVRNGPGGNIIFESEQSAPVVPDEISTSDAMRIMNGRVITMSVHTAYKNGWNACRAAMLAAEPSAPVVKLPPCVDDLHGVGMVMSADAVKAALDAAGVIAEGGNSEILQDANCKSELSQRASQILADATELANRISDQVGNEYQQFASLARSQMNPRKLVRIEHANWSDETFGNVGPVGPLKHLAKEAIEAAENPGDLSEWADMQFLLWDAQRRAGYSDEQITKAMVKKLAENKARSWPEPKDGEPRHHIKKGAE